MPMTPRSDFRRSRAGACSRSAPAASRGAVLARAGGRADCGSTSRRATSQPMPIAMPDFVGGTPGDTEVARGITQVITANLRRTGLFAPIDPAAFIEKITNFDALPRFPDWRAINAQALVTGRVTRQGDGRLKVEFRLWDVFAGQQLTGQQYFTTPDNWRRIAHIISDAIYERLTGEKGYFDTPHRVRRRDRAEGAPRQAARDHGSGRRQRALSDARRGPRADAALLAVDAGNHLHVLRAGRSARLPAQHRDRPARDRRQFPRHDLRAALLAGRPARDHEPAAGRRTPTSS